MKDPRSKFNVLKGSYESGIIGKEEFEKEKEKLEPKLKEFDKKIEDSEKQGEEEIRKSSEKALIIGIIIIIVLFAAVIGYAALSRQEPKSIEELHVMNLKGQLKPSQGYVYKNVYSFVTLDDSWYTQLASPKGTKIYNLALRFSPKDLESIAIEGNLDKEFFDTQNEFFVTFNPIGKDFSDVSLAVADFGTHMSKVFEKTPVAACDRNETELCRQRPIVTCEDSDKLVFYVKEASKLRAYYKGNCIVVEGTGLDLVKGVDRILYDLYGIMGQEEA